MRTPIVDGRSIDQFIPANLRGMFYKHPMPEYKYAIHDGYAPYSFSIDGLVTYLPLWALREDSFKSVDAYKNTATVTNALWQPDGRIFDGDDYIDITPVLTNALASLTIGTIGFWVKVPDATPAAGMGLMTFGDTDGSEYLRIFFQSTSKFYCDVALAGVLQWRLTTDNAVFSDNVWAYAELIHNGTEPSLRINGAAPAQTITEDADKSIWFSAMAGLDNGFIGKASFAYNANRSFLTGTIGEVIIHNRALPTAEGLHNYLATKWRYT